MGDTLGLGKAETPRAFWVEVLSMTWGHGREQLGVEGKVIRSELVWGCVCLFVLQFS